MAKTTLTRKIGMGFLALVVLYLLGYFLFLDFIVEYLWFGSMDYSGYFWLRFFYKFLIAGGITILFFLMFFTHFWIASRYLGTEVSADQDNDSNSLSQKLKTGAMEIYTPLSLLLAIIVAIPFYTQWESALLFLFSRESGISEGVYGNDISFYLFSLPIFKIIQKELLVTSVLLFAGVAFLYFLEQRILAKRGKTLPMGSVIHRILLIGFVCAWVVWGFLLQRFNLLYSDAHEPLFYGPGWVEMRYHLPLIWLAVISFIITAYAAIMIVLTDGKRGTKVLLASLVVLAISIALRVIPAIPKIIDDYVVIPNQFRLEKQFINNNIKATLNAYKLDQAKSVKIPLTSSSYADLARGIKEEFNHNIPLWDKVYLDDVYNQMQAITPYYRFVSVDEDRYTINGSLHQVNLGAREIDLKKLPKASHTWQNIHLRYTHGYGFAMTPAAQEANRPMQWYVRNLTLKSPVGISVERPDIYYGQSKYPYVIVPNDLDVAGIPSTVGKDPNQHVHLGEGGIHIGSIWRKFVFSVYFSDPLIFMSTDLNPASRLRMRRNITERVQSLAPELVLDEDPYLVAAEKDLYWIQDAYTFSEYYPISKPSVALVHTASGPEQKRFNYTRNSVKIAINAYDGIVRFYVSDPTDPIIQAYMRAYPGVFKPIDQLPEKLKTHLRYPEDLFKHQLQIFARYHQTDPSVFYQQAETWSLATIDDEPMPPYYLTTNLNIPGCNGSTQFMQIGAMTRVNRANLSSLLIGGAPDGNSCNDDGSLSQDLVSLELPKELQVNGPAQIAALIHQDPAISGKFTLWNQQGSTVKLGHMIILPVSNTMVYIQPVYLLADKNSIPQLVRVIVSATDEVVMDVSLQKAFDQLLAKLKTH
ncbi:MAG: UPF0182 family protein [Methylococcales bacterium]